VRGELVYRVLLQSTQPAQLADHHKVDCGMNRFAKSTHANQLAYAHPGKVCLFAEQHTL
jgi:hypothetical protein